MSAFGLPLPTDNLYKFYALTGVAIVLFTVYTVNRLTEELLHRVRATSLAVDKAEIESDFLKHQKDRIKEIGNGAKANLSDEDARKQGKVPLHISEEEFEKMLVQTEELDRDFRLRLAEARSASNENGQALRSLKDVRIVGMILGIFGGLLALYGFKKWSVIQQMQDKALEREFPELPSLSLGKPGPGVLFFLTAVALIAFEVFTYLDTHASQQRERKEAAAPTPAPTTSQTPHQ
jgi:hypothetical protein